MITLLTVYGIGAFLSFLILGYFTAAFALGNRITYDQGMVFFISDIALKKLAVVLIWPLVFSYIVSYRGLLYYVIYMNNRELKRQAANPPPYVPIIVDEEELTPVVETKLASSGLN